MMDGFFLILKKRRISRRLYAKRDRAPFYRFAGKYLPEDPDAKVVDIGCGNGAFAETLNLAEKYENLFLLDGNKNTIEKLFGTYRNAKHYNVPMELPFDSSSVAFAHCSHLVEHLPAQDLYALLQEIKRIIMPGGVFIVSAPYLTSVFYNDLSHVKPYNPNVFSSYLCAVDNGNRTRSTLGGFQTKEIVWRYRRKENWKSGEGLCHKLYLVDVVILAVSVVIAKLGFMWLKRDGFTMVLQRTNTEE